MILVFIPLSVVLVKGPVKNEDDRPCESFSIQFQCSTSTTRVSWSPNKQITRTVPSPPHYGEEVPAAAPGSLSAKAPRR